MILICLDNYCHLILLWFSFKTSFCVAAWLCEMTAKPPLSCTRMFGCKRNAIFCAINVDLCQKCHITVNLFDQVTSSMHSHMHSHRYTRNVRNCTVLHLNKQLGHVPHAMHETNTNWLAPPITKLNQVHQLQRLFCSWWRPSWSKRSTINLLATRSAQSTSRERCG